jgi:hypothetical protein
MWKIFHMIKVRLCTPAADLLTRPTAPDSPICGLRTGGNAMAHNPWTISLAALQRHAECWANGLRMAALLLALLTVMWVLYLAMFVLFADAYVHADVGWSIARLAVLILLATLLLFISRTVWNFSNVWLGRAGTLEDLILALRLIGKGPADQEVPQGQLSTLLSQPLSDVQAKRLQMVVESLGRLRRDFEGDLLKGLPVDQFGKIEAPKK